MSFSPFANNDVEIQQDSLIYEGHSALRLLTLRFKLFNGGWSQLVNRELLQRGKAVVVLLYDPKQDAVVLIEQLRVGAIDYDASPWLLECVAGVVENGESSADVAVRETQEEAGLMIGVPRFLFEYYTSPGISDELSSLFYAEVDSRLASGVHGLIAEGEDIRVHVISIEQVMAMLQAGQIRNVNTIIALQWLQLQLISAH